MLFLSGHVLSCLSSISHRVIRDCIDYSRRKRPDDTFLALQSFSSIDYSEQKKCQPQTKLMTDWIGSVVIE